MQDAESRHHATLLLCCCKSKKNIGHFHEDNASSVLQFGSPIPIPHRSLVPHLKSSKLSDWWQSERIVLGSTCARTLERVLCIGVLSLASVHAGLLKVIVFRE